MNIIFIYGPPGVGKLTVAQEVAALTGYRVFHNHLTLNCVAPVFDWDESFWRLVFAMREMVIEEAAARDVSLIMTAVYGLEGALGRDDEAHFQPLFDAAERRGGRVRLVRLTCDQSELEQRVTAGERAPIFKVHVVDELRHLLSLYDPSIAVPDRESLTIDNTHLSPKDAARLIVEHYGLRRG